MAGDGARKGDRGHRQDLDTTECCQKNMICRAIRPFIIKNGYYLTP